MERKRDAGKVKRDRTSEECGGSEGGRTMIQLLEASRLLRPNPIMMSYDRGRDSDMVQCVIVRDVSMTLGTVDAGELRSRQAKDTNLLPRLIE